MNKKKILIVTETSARLVDLIYSGLLDKIKNKYDLDFLIKDKHITKNSNYKNDCEEYLKTNFITTTSNATSASIKANLTSFIAFAISLSDNEPFPLILSKAETNLSLKLSNIYKSILKKQLSPAYEYRRPV